MPINLHTNSCQLTDNDRQLLAAYNAIDRDGEAYADADCAYLTDNWRETAKATIARHAEAELIECDSPDGFSLHAPGSSDEDIADGTAPPLVCGDGRPAEADYLEAWLSHTCTPSR
jgi:hypothetical protein